MPLQAASQWDGLAHAYYDDLLHNGFPASDITPLGEILDFEELADQVPAGGRVPGQSAGDPVSRVSKTGARPRHRVDRVEGTQS